MLSASFWKKDKGNLSIQHCPAPGQDHIKQSVQNKQKKVEKAHELI